MDMVRVTITVKIYMRLSYRAFSHFASIHIQFVFKQNETVYKYIYIVS
jgi:hypothetical protein